MAATVIGVSIVLVATLGSWWLILTGFVAANLLLFSLVGWCPASLIMAKAGMQRYSHCSTTGTASSAD
jgi:hypothetical protein